MHGTKIRILCHNKESESIRDRHLRESRYYTKEEIISICEQNDMSIDKFIDLILSNHSKYSEEYRELIEQGKIWIGKTKMTDTFVENNFDRIKEIANIALLDTKKKLQINYNIDDEDFIQGAILNLISNRGDIEKNFDGKDEIMNMCLYTSIRRYIWFRELEKQKVRYKVLSLEKKRYKRKNKRENIASSNDTEGTVIEKIESENVEKDNESFDITEKCIKELREQIEAGMPKENALKNTAEKLNLDKQEMIDAMQNYLITKGKVKLTETKEELVDDDYER